MFGLEEEMEEEQENEQGRGITEARTGGAGGIPPPSAILISMYFLRR